MSPTPPGGTGKVMLVLSLGGAEIGIGWLPGIMTVEFEKLIRISS